MTRRHVLVTASALAVTACESLPSFDSARRAFDFALYGQPDVPLERSRVDTLPYASIRAKMGHSGRVLMILGRYEGRDLHWISADNVALVTRGGRLVKTAGLPLNLKETVLLGADPVAGALNRLNGGAALRRVVDLDFEGRYGVPIDAEITPLGFASIEILERRYDTVVVREDNVAATLDWSFTNYFWAERTTGFVWRSFQHFSPDLPAVEIEVLKPAA